MEKNKVATEYLSFSRSPVRPYKKKVRLIKNFVEFDNFAKNLIPKEEPVALLLSGVDSASLTKYLAPGSLCITVSFPEGLPKYDESGFASSLTPKNCTHETKKVTKEEMWENLDLLLKDSLSPHTTCTPGMFSGFLLAKERGFNKVISGVMADSHYGSYFYLKK